MPDAGVFFEQVFTQVHSSKIPENRVFGLSNRVLAFSNRVLALSNRVFGIFMEFLLFERRFSSVFAQNMTF